MAKASHKPERAGFVFGLCQDTAVYLKLAYAANASGLAPGTVRAAGKLSALTAIETDLRQGDDALPKAWREHMVPLEHVDDEPYFANDDEPLLHACFSCLSATPGGAPWQGSWRRNRLHEVLRAIDEGGILLAVEAHSLDEQRSWARTLLKSGCAFVQTYDDVLCS
ncbi:MAG: hypothetical protein R3D51_07375 [Hyphomicrobiaceae bacterium]